MWRSTLTELASQKIAASDKEVPLKLPSSSNANPRAAFARDFATHKKFHPMD
jgi:hypothetical protein